MANVNPEQPAKGKYSPVHRVTGIFFNTDHLTPVLDGLQQAGFTEQEVDLFIGEDGAEKLDLKGKKLSAIVRFLRDLEVSLTDETETHRHLDEILRAGGMSINILVGDDEKKKVQAAHVLKEQGSHDVRYWGHWSVERF